MGTFGESDGPGRELAGTHCQAEFTRSLAAKQEKMMAGRSGAISRIFRRWSAPPFQARPQCFVHECHWQSRGTMQRRMSRSCHVREALRGSRIQGWLNLLPKERTPSRLPGCDSGILCGYRRTRQRHFPLAGCGSGRMLGAES